MAKQSGLGDNFYIGGYDLSGDVNALGSISSPSATLEMTGINKSAIERLTGLRSGHMEFTSFFNDAAGQEHPILKTLPTADTQVTYFRGTAIGNAAAVMTGKQINYDGTRAVDGGFTFNVTAESNSYGLEWGQQLTAGIRTDTGATNGSSLDTTASLSFGAQVYIQVFSFSGTDVVIKVKDSADNSAFAALTPAQEVLVSSAPTFSRVTPTANTATIRRYLRVETSTTGGFTSCAFAVVVVKNGFAGLVF